MRVRHPVLRVLLEGLAVLIVVAGCRSSDWTLAVWNDSGQQVVVQISSGPDRSAWLVAVDEAFVIIQSPQPIAGTVELIDPKTCELLDQRDIPAKTSIISPVVDASRPRGLSLAIMLDDRLTHEDRRSPNFQGCIG